MATYHTVQQGEHVSRIAGKYGFNTFRVIWERPENKDLRDRRQNPNVLLPGDRLFIPDKQIKREGRPTGQRHRFKVSVEKLNLRLVVRDLDSNPITNAPCELKVEGQTYQLTTNGAGMIEQLIPKTAESGQLKIRDIQIPIKIGHLDPVDVVAGWRARLNNLGYNAGASEDINDPQMRSAVEEFQCDYELTVDGVCGPQTQAKLKEVHGC